MHDLERMSWLLSPYTLVKSPDNQLSSIDREVITIALVHICAILSESEEKAKEHLPNFDSKSFNICKALLNEKCWSACRDHSLGQCSETGDASLHPFLHATSIQASDNWPGIK